MVSEKHTADVVLPGMCHLANLTVCDAMKLADFSLREREDKVKYMMVLWLLNKTKKDDFVTPPIQSITTVSRSISEPVTMSSADSSLVTSAQAKKAKIVRSTATVMQMRCMAALEKRKNTTLPSNMQQFCTRGRKGRMMACLQG